MQPAIEQAAKRRKVSHNESPQSTSASLDQYNKTISLSRGQCGPSSVRSHGEPQESSLHEIEASSASQTNLESALPEVKSDKQAIADYEVSAHALSIDGPRDRLGRISSSSWERGRSSIYVDAFNLALETVLQDEKHLFSVGELAVFDLWQTLTYGAQYLYVRLFLRKTSAWHRTSKLSYYGDIADMSGALEALWVARAIPQETGQLPAFAGDLDPPIRNALESIVSFADNSSHCITSLEEASSLLTLDELKELAKGVKASGKNKSELLAAFRKASNSQGGLTNALFLGSESNDSQETTGAVSITRSTILHASESAKTKLSDTSGIVNLDRLFLDRIKERIGPCIRLSLPVLKLFERVHLVFYRSTEWTEKSLTTLILARILKRNFPTYIVSRSANIFPTREALLEFESSMRVQFAVDSLLEFSGTPTKVAFPKVMEIFEQVLPRWRTIVKHEQLREERDYDSGEGAYLRRFSPAWVYTRIVHKGTYVLGRLHEHKREWAILGELLEQRLFHFSRRGAWYQRKALLEEHYMADLLPTEGRGSDAQRRHYRNVSLATCELGLQDPDCHVIYHYDLQKRILKLERALCIAKRLQHDFGHVKLTKPTERTFEGIRVRKKTPSRSPSRPRSLGLQQADSSGAVASLSRQDTVSVSDEPAHKPAGGSAARSPSAQRPARDSGKTMWLDPSEKGTCSVEAMCLSRYRELGYKGYHSEGSILRTLFAYLFYDVLFLYAPNVFQTEYQTCPLDLHTDAFYPTRSSEIQARLVEISNGQADQLVEKVWVGHHDRQTCVVGLNWDFQLHDLLEIVRCFRGEQLAGICQVMAQEYGERGGGIPDLFMWRLHKTEGTPDELTVRGEVLFAEVKSENDRLSDTQRLWIHVLTSHGVAVELCNAVASDLIDEEEVGRRLGEAQV